MKIIGVGGTNGSGKDTLGHLLATDYGWFFVSVTDILREELKRRGLPIDRANLRHLSSEWHHQHGAGILTDMAVKKFQEQNEQYNGLVMASLRRPGEVQRLHELGGQLVWLDADPKLRYERTLDRSRSPEDQQTFAQFLEQEKIEMYGGDSKSTLNMSQVREMADITITNNSNDIEEFKKLVKDALHL